MNERRQILSCSSLFHTICNRLPTLLPSWNPIKIRSFNSFQHREREREREREMGRVIVAWAVIALLCVSMGEAIWLNLPESGTKCVSEEIHNNVVVLADFVVVSDDVSGHVPTISCKVTSPYGNNLHHSDNVKHGQFAFTTQEAGNYLACFWLSGNNHSSGPVSVSLDWRTGIAAKDWDSVAKKEKLEGIELELRKLEGAVEAIHENLIYLKGREADMRTVSETTNGRVAWFSIMSLGICIAVSALQLWYLKSFFQKKKLI